MWAFYMEVNLELSFNIPKLTWSSEMLCECPYRDF